MTFRLLGQAEPLNVPGNAMTLDAVLNICLLVFAGAGGRRYLQMLAVSNFGYVLSHVFAMSGFLLLRRDRPAGRGRSGSARRGWPSRGSAWSTTSSCWSSGRSRSSSPATASSYSILVWSLVVPVVALLAYIYRVMVEDKKPLQLAAAGTDHAGGRGRHARRRRRRPRPPSARSPFLRPLQCSGRRNGARAVIACGVADGSWSRRQIAVLSAFVAAPASHVAPAASRAVARRSAETTGFASEPAASRSGSALPTVMRAMPCGVGTRSFCPARARSTCGGTSLPGSAMPALRLPSQLTGIELDTMRTRVPPCALRHPRTAAALGDARAGRARRSGASARRRSQRGRRRASRPAARAPRRSGRASLEAAVDDGGLLPADRELRAPCAP